VPVGPPDLWRPAGKRRRWADKLPCPSELEGIQMPRRRPAVPPRTTDPPIHPSTSRPRRVQLPRAAADQKCISPRRGNARRAFVFASRSELCPCACTRRSGAACTLRRRDQCLDFALRCAVPPTPNPPVDAAARRWCLFQRCHFGATSKVERLRKLPCGSKTICPACACLFQRWPRNRPQRRAPPRPRTWSSLRSPHAASNLCR